MGYIGLTPTTDPITFESQHFQRAQLSLQASPLLDFGRTTPPRATWRYPSCTSPRDPNWTWGGQNGARGGGGGGCGRQPSNQNIWAKQQQNPLIMILNDDILIMFSFRGSLSHGLYVILIELGNSSFPKKKQITKNLCHC